VDSRAYADKAKNEILQSLQVPGIVNNQDFSNDFEAGKENQFYSLGTWLKANDQAMKERLREIHRKFELLSTEDSLRKDSMNANFEQLAAVQESLAIANQNISTSKDDADKKKAKLETKIESNQN
jgi:hypothetical protein